MMETDRPVVHFVTVVWGREHTDLYCGVALPSQLSEGNIPALADELELHYFLYTTQEDAAQITASPPWKELSLHAFVHVEILTDANDSEKFSRVTRNHVNASNRAAREGAYISFLTPDSIYANGSIGGLLAYVREKKEAVVTLGMRTRCASVLAALEGHIKKNPVSLSVSPRDAVRLTLDHMHPIERGWFWGSPDHGKWLSHVYLSLPSNGFIAHCWHLHPILVKPLRSVPNRGLGTIDGGWYIDWVTQNPNQVVVIQDSDKFFSMELSPDSYDIPGQVAGPISVTHLAKWARFNGTGIFRSYFKKPIWVHTTDLTSDEQRYREQFEQLISSTVVGPVLYLSRWWWLFHPFAVLVTRLKRINLDNFLLFRRNFLNGISNGVGYLWKKALSRLLSVYPPLRGKFIRVAGSLMSVARSGQKDGVFAAKIEAHSLIERQRQLASELARFGEVDEAQKMIRRLASADDPPLQASLQNDLFVASMDALNKGQLDVALNAAKLAKSVSPTVENGFYVDLISVLVDLRREAYSRAEAIGGISPGVDRHVFSAVVWGNDYIDNFMRYTVRSMLAPGNLPALADSEVYFAIMTTPSGVERISASTFYPLLTKYCRVEFFPFPEDLTKSFHYSRPNFDYYRLYGALDHTAIHFARALKANIFFIVVDGILSGNSIGNLRRYVAEGYDICANASIVSNRETLLPELDKKYGDAEVIDITARDLANIGFAHRHNYIEQRLVVPDNRDFDKYPRELYFPTEEGLVVHALYQHPLVVSAKAIGGDIELDYFIVDSKLMARILHDPATFSRLKVVTDSDDVYVANFAPRDRKFDTTGRPLNERDFVAVHMYSEPVHHYIWQQRQLVRCDTRLRTHLDPATVSQRFLKKLIEAQARK